jgi:molybdopterin-dependent oxidoreductase alpha subunit
MADETLPVLTSGPPVPGDAGIAGLVPFGLDKTKPRHYREMLGVLWENRDALPWAWKVLNHGVCDGCSLGPRGLQDDVIPGTHLCMSRLKLLRNNTIGAFDESALADVAHLRTLSNGQLRELGRMPYPFVRRPGDPGFTRVSWDEALGLIGDKLRDTPPDRQGWFATSKGLTNETYYAFTKAARLMGTNNVDFCARLCHAATVAGLSRTIGVGAPTISLSDLIGTDLILLWGTNLANNQPVSVKYLHHAKEAGTRIVQINTVREKGLDAYWIPSIPKSAVFGSKLADEFIQVRVGGDLALMCAVLKLLVAGDHVDRAYIDAHTEGFEAMSAALDDLALDELYRQAGVAERDAVRLAELIARARSMVTVYSMGLTQHTHGTQNVMGVVNLHLSQGALGKEKNGILPIRGHSGVQGGGECGVSPGKYPGGFKVNEENAARFERIWGHPVPTGPGLSTGPMMEAAHEGAIDFLYSLGGNLLTTMPDTAWMEQALGRVALRVHQDINVNEAMLIDPGELCVLLPARTRYEQEGGGTSTSTERRIRFSPQIPGHPHIGEARSEWRVPGQIVAAARPDLADAFAWESGDAIRAEMDVAMPVYAGIKDLKEEGQWVQWGGPQLCRDGDFGNLPGGKARFSALVPPELATPEGQFVLTTRRGKQFNSMIFDGGDTLQGGLRRDDVFLNPDDAKRLGAVEGQYVTLANDLGTFLGVVRLAEIAPGCIQAYWPEVNVLIPARWDPLSAEPDYNCYVAVRPGKE